MNQYYNNPDNNMCRTMKEISMNDPLVQELDDYITANNLPPTEKLLLRLAKHNYIFSMQTKEDIQDMKENPSLLYLLRHKTRPTLVTLFSIGAGWYFLFHIIDHFVGFEEVLNLWIP